MDRNEALKKLNDTSTRLFSLNLNECTDKQAYKVVCTLLRETLAAKRKEFRKNRNPDGRRF